MADNMDYDGIEMQKGEKMSTNVKIAREQLLIIAILAEQKVGSAIREVVSKYLDPKVRDNEPNLVKRKPGRPRAQA